MKSVCALRLVAECFVPIINRKFLALQLSALYPLIVADTLLHELGHYLTASTLHLNATLYFNFLDPAHFGYTTFSPVGASWMGMAVRVSGLLGAACLAPVFIVLYGWVGWWIAAVDVGYCVAEAFVCFGIPVWPVLTMLLLGGAVLFIVRVIRVISKAV